jgi:hypothetical protein
MISKSDYKIGSFRFILNNDPDGICKTIVRFPTFRIKRFKLVPDISNIN